MRRTHVYGTGWHAQSSSIPRSTPRLTALAQRTGRTKSFYMNRAIESALEEIELAYSLQAELEDIRSGRAASVSLDEAVKSLGLEG